MATGAHVERLRTSWVWLAVLGAIALIGGILALANPFAATLAATLLAGWTFLLFGVVQLIQAFRITGWSGFLWALLLGLLTAAVGISLLFNPVAGALSKDQRLAGLITQLRQMPMNSVGQWIVSADCLCFFQPPSRGVVADLRPYLVEIASGRQCR